MRKEKTYLDSSPWPLAIDISSKCNCTPHEDDLNEFCGKNFFYAYLNAPALEFNKQFNEKTVGNGSSL